jgi:hypothetical protein
MQVSKWFFIWDLENQKRRASATQHLEHSTWNAVLVERGRRRTRQDQISLWGFEARKALRPVKLRSLEIRTERRKTYFFCRTGFRKSELS